jgi:hypothetical protein|eukprot:SAG25_NODE_124_length_14606_cov_739.419177_20_plen_45_part_00
MSFNPFLWAGYLCAVPVLALVFAGVAAPLVTVLQQVPSLHLTDH